MGDAQRHPGTPWALVSLRLGGPGGSEQARVGTQAVGGGVVRLPELLAGCRDVMDVLRRWEALEPALRDLTADGELVQDPVLLTPLRYPSKILCSGPNYHDHLAEMGQAGLGDAWTAYFFFKPPTTSLVGPVDPVLVGPQWESDRVDWEGELAVVIGKGGRDIDASDALSHVAGYAVANDISLRGPHRRDTPAEPFVWDWVASKGADSSLPLGPGVVPVWHVPDTTGLPIRTLVNGSVKQDGNTRDMVLDVPALIADASRLVTLEPGDVIVTGTPAGVGAGRGEFLRPGDLVEVEIPGVGRLANTVRVRA